jgi:23S rRNA pseudouridine1911/1915/1917 synthase
LVVHPPQHGYDKTLVNALLYKKKELYSCQPLRPGIVHRLDKETSGIMVVAKTKTAYESLIRQFKARTIQKEYIAICHGIIEKDSIRVNLPLARDKRNRLKMKVSMLESKEAFTDVTVIKRFKNSTYLSVKILTGRMHQIRVHLKFLGHPLLGDKKYGIKDGYENLFLHAHRLGFVHPVTTQNIKFESPLPEIFSAFLEARGKNV